MDGQCQFNSSNPLPADVVICDEASMVDGALAYCLLRALRPGTQLILVGDPDQLPPIGAGALLMDVLNCAPPLRCIRLTARAPPGRPGPPSPPPFAPPLHALGPLPLGTSAMQGTAPFRCRSGHHFGAGMRCPRPRPCGQWCGCAASRRRRRAALGCS